MRTERILAVACVALLGLAPVVVTPAVAGGSSKGVPDAPPIEKILARHDGFIFPTGFVTGDGHKLPQGEYDLVLIESSDRYFIQLINRQTHRGVRVAAEASGELIRELTSPEPTVSLQSDEGHERFEFQLGSFTASVALKLRTSG